MPTFFKIKKWKIKNVKKRKNVTKIKKRKRNVFLHRWWKTDLGGVVDLAGREVGGTEAADGVADVDARRRDDGEQRQQEDGPLAAQLVAEAVGAAQLGVVDVAEEEEQPLQHAGDVSTFFEFRREKTSDTRIAVVVSNN